MEKVGLRDLTPKVMDDLEVVINGVHFVRGEELLKAQQERNVALDHARNFEDRLRQFKVLLEGIEVPAPPKPRRWRRAAWGAWWLLLIGILVGGSLPRIHDAPHLGSADKPEVVTQPSSVKPEVVTSPQTLSWAPSPGATSYRVVIYREDGSTLTQRNTQKPTTQIAIPAGTYRWVVWPITSSGRSGVAIVNARLTR